MEHGGAEAGDLRKIPWLPPPLRSAADGVALNPWWILQQILAAAVAVLITILDNFPYGFLDLLIEKDFPFSHRLSLVNPNPNPS